MKFFYLKSFPQAEITLTTKKVAPHLGWDSAAVCIFVLSYLAAPFWKSKRLFWGNRKQNVACSF